MKYFENLITSRLYSFMETSVRLTSIRRLLQPRRKNFSLTEKYRAFAPADVFLKEHSLRCVLCFQNN